MITTKVKASIILGGMFLAGLIGGVPAHAQTASSTDGVTLGGFLDVKALCVAQGAETASWKLQASQDPIAYAFDADRGQSGSGTLQGEESRTVTLQRGVNGTQVNFRWGRAAYNLLVNSAVVGEGSQCPEMVNTPAQPAQEDPQLISLMERIIELLKQIIALRLAR